MNRSVIGTALLLTAIVASWSVIGIVECLASAVLLLTTHFVLAGSKRNVCWGFLGIRIALSWADWFIFDFWISAGLLLCRQLLLVSIGILILKGLLRSPPQKSDPAPPVRLLLLAGSPFLVVTVIGIGAYLIDQFYGRRVSEHSMSQILIVAGLAALAYFGFMVTGIWLLRSPPQKSDPAPPVRRLLLAGSPFLVVTVIGIGAYLYANLIDQFYGRRVSEHSMSQILIVAGVAVLAHFGFMVTGIWRRSGAVALIYPVVFLVIGAAIVPLQPKPLDLLSVLDTGAGYEGQGDRPPSVPVNIALECLLHHKDSAVRGCCYAGRWV